MLYESITQLTTELNQYFQLVSSRSDMVVAANLLSQAGQEIATLNNRIVLSIVSLEEDRIHRSKEQHIRQPDGSFEVVNPEVKLNLLLLFTANFQETSGISDNYMEGMRALSNLIGFFQSKSVFTPQNSPGLHQNIEKLSLEMNSLTLEQQNHLWGAIGAKYMPSVLYRMRVLSIQRQEPYTTGPPITDIAINERDTSS
jgi:hypothetical protein